MALGWIGDGWRITVVCGATDEKDDTGSDLGGDEGSEAMGYEVVSVEEMPELHQRLLHVLLAARQTDDEYCTRILGVGELYNWDTDSHSAGPTMYIHHKAWGDVPAVKEEYP